ncbi:MAG: enoyl-CoA hydratase/isomerase family protein [Gammaproteobacteria bacterium]|nr:enoyl-CoA hydratase/isomerase family protein [Gammaproteobacteria bacterium]MDH5500156.1 enoyl-CoA hydratase/isomerase family protein [Gammaproteobacteria bacterium]
MTTIEYISHESIAEIRLNRPQKLNAIDSAMLDGLADALDRAEADGDVRAILLSGEGRAFSAGFDLDIGKPAAGVSQIEHTKRELQRDYDLILRFWDCPKPTVAAVHGYCLGSSMEISAVCDVTISSDDCLFGAPEVRFGSGIVCMILPWIIGLKNANELLLGGDAKIDASRAAAMGLINRVVPAGDLTTNAMAMARQLAENDATAVQLTKQAIHRSLEIAGLREALAQALEIDKQIETRGRSA